MALEGTQHLITALYQVKGWNLYKTTVNKSGKIVSRVYKQQIVQGKQVANVTKTITDKTTKMSTTFTKATGKTNDLMKALRRAAIVAPVWLALRSIMMKTIRTITDGAKAWEEWDKALIKSKAVIHTTSMDISTAYIRLQDEVEKLSLRTGISLDKITNAFFRFGTLGIEFEESLAGMNAAVNISLALGGNLEQVVRPLAFAYDLLGDTMDQTIPVSERLEQLGSKMFAIWKINAFEIDGFSQALLNFLPTANAMNFSLDETVALLSAMSSSAILAGRGGRLLRQSVLRLSANLGILGTQLGLAVNPELESSNEILLKVLKRIKELGEAGTVQKAGAALTAIFGGARMGEAARGLISVYDLIEKNIDITTASGEVLDKQMKEYAERLKTVEDALNRQLEIGRNLSKQSGRVFLKGIFGGKEYAETIKKINEAKRGMLPIIESIAKATRDYFLSGESYGSSYLAMLQKINREKDRLGITPEEVTAGMKFRPELGRYTGEWTEEEIEAFKKEEEVIKRIKYENQIKLNLLQEGLEISKLEAKGLSKSQIIYKGLTAEVKERVKQHNELIDLEKVGYEKLEEKQILLLLEGREYEKLLALGGERIFTQDKLNELMKDQIDYEAASFKEKQSAIKLLVAHEMNLAKIRGTVSSELIEMNIEMNKQLGIGQNSLSLLKNQLALEVAINKEKKAGTKISSETIKLYEIGQKYGYRIMQQISDYSKGISRYIGREAELVMKKEMAGKYAEREAYEAIKRGYFGVMEIQEEYLKPGYRAPTPDIARLQKRAELPKIPTVVPKVDIKTAIQEIKVILPEGSLDKMAENVGETVKQALLTDEKYQKDLMGKLRKYA